MKITVNWLKKREACDKGIKWFENQKETDPILIMKKLINSFSKKKKIWAYWLFVEIRNFLLCTRKYEYQKLFKYFYKYNLDTYNNLKYAIKQYLKSKKEGRKNEPR